MSDAEDDMDASHVALSETNGEAFQVHGLGLFEYKDEGVVIHMDQIMDPNYTLYYICNKLYRNLAESTSRICFHSRYGMMSLFLCCAWNPSWQYWTVWSREENGWKIVNEQTGMVIMDGLHLQNAIEMLEEESGFPWKGERYCALCHADRRNSYE